MSETARRTENAFDTEVIVVNASPVVLTPGCALRHHGTDRVLHNDEASGSRADRRLWAERHSLHGGCGRQLRLGGALDCCCRPRDAKVPACPAPTLSSKQRRMHAAGTSLESPTIGRPVSARLQLRGWRLRA